MRPLLMIPGPIEVSPSVRAAHDVVPPAHQAPDLIAAYGEALELTLQVWKARADAEPFIVPGSGTAAMEMAAANLVQPGTRALVVDTGYFSRRMMEILRRYGAEVASVGGEPGQAPGIEEIRSAARAQRPEVVFATHVDTSTGVRMEPCHVTEAVAEVEPLTVFDGVCATAAEAFDMDRLGADVYLTGSQKALGLPPGLAFAVFSARALARRGQVASPPLYFDVESWRPVMAAYREGKPSYFATPATNLVMAARAGLQEIVEARWGGETGTAARWAQHAHTAKAMGAAWAAMGLEHLAPPELRGVTLSALKVPPGVTEPVPPKVKAHGVVVAGGLYPGLQKTYFRVGHMGYCITQPAMLERTVEAVASALFELGWPEANRDRAVAAFRKAHDEAPSP
jgi:alanine-glyoxylate transaminase/serine-glyoxylate transaminase/serine-pyruvate transaminase